MVLTTFTLSGFSVLFRQLKRIRSKPWVRTSLKYPKKTFFSRNVFAEDSLPDFKFKINYCVIFPALCLRIRLWVNEKWRWRWWRWGRSGPRCAWQGWDWHTGCFWLRVARRNQSLATTRWIEQQQGSKQLVRVVYIVDYVVNKLELICKVEYVVKKLETWGSKTKYEGLVHQRNRARPRHNVEDLPAMSLMCALQKCKEDWLIPLKMWILLPSIFKRALWLVVAICCKVNCRASAIIYWGYSSLWRLLCYDWALYSRH